ncbi:MAG: hypothetical protein KKB62_03545 [Nanoarchaeota archaeon]|nr:hypothetical protein [Nanoarchaeota archaeon]
MVYWYKDNKTFINKTQNLLDKLDEKGLLSKDTLIIALDKSVRPLAYTLKKLSDLEGKETPSIKFFNYSSHKYEGKEELDQIYNHWKDKINSFDFSKYKNIILMDEGYYSGKTLDNAKFFLKKYVPGIKNQPIYFAVLGIENSPPSNEGSLIFVDKNVHIYPADEKESGVIDKWIPKFNFKEKFTESEMYKKYGSEYSFKESRRNTDSEKLKLFGLPKKNIKYKEFIQNRTELRSDIIKYVKKKQTTKEKTGSLEKKLLGVASLGGFIFSLFFLSNNITGNAIGNLDSVSNNAAGILIFMASFLLGFLALKK